MRITARSLETLGLVAGIFCLAACAPSESGDARDLLASPTRVVSTRASLDAGLATTLLNRARAYETRYDQLHSPNGLGHDVEMQGDVVIRRHGVSDCAIWTGAYTGGAALRYRLYHDAASRAALHKAVSGLHLLQAVTGRPGLYARCAWRAEDLVEEPDVDAPNMHTGAPGYEQYRWLGHVSQDQISGLIFGLGLAFDNSDDEGDRALIAADLSAFAHHLIGNGLKIVDVDDQPTHYGDFNPPTQTFLGVGVGGFAATMALAIFKIAAHASGEAELESYYRDILIGQRHFETLVRDQLNIEVPDSLKALRASAECDTNYDNFNMMFLSIFNLIRYETDPDLLALYRTALREHLWDDPGAPPILGGIPLLGSPNHREVRKQGNAFWTYLTHAADPSLYDAEALADAEVSLGDFWDAPAAGPIEHDNQGDYPGQCLDRFDSPMHKDSVIPMPLRAPSTFVWHGNPYGVHWGAGLEQHGGMDYQAAYWVGRAYGLLGFPDADSDGLTDDREAAWGTRPDIADSDGGGVTDGVEIDVQHTDPLDPNDDIAPTGHDSGPVGGDSIASPGDSATAGGDAATVGSGGDAVGLVGTSGCACDDSGASGGLLDFGAMVAAGLSRLRRRRDSRS